VPEFERMLVRSGIRLIKYWFSITDESSTCASSAASTTR
jgi:polyphosphate kinase 2 (PPK2 family)